jgi:GT2 family glycosyltransferase
MISREDVRSEGRRPKVAIIVLNWNGWPDTLECLESLQHLAYPNFQVIVVDNGSSNDSVEKIKDWCQGKIPVQTHFVEFEPRLKPVARLDYNRREAESGGDVRRETEVETSPSQTRLVLIQTGENLGFAGGNNVALRYCLKRDYGYLWLLNNDTVVDSASLAEMIEIAESEGTIGVAGPMILFYSRPQYIFSAGISLAKIGRRVRRIGIMKNFDAPLFNTTRDVEGIAGCALLIRRDSVRTIGLLDERYFLYMEEADWCTRAIQNHFRCVYVPKARVWHKGWGSVQREAGLLDYYLARSQILYLKKFSSGVRFVLDVLAYGARSFLKVAQKSLRTGDFRGWRAHLLGLAHGFSGNYAYRWHETKTLHRGRRQDGRAT